MWIGIIEFFIAFAGIGTFLYFVIKLAIEKFMEAGLERYKAQLNVDLETHKAALSRITQEHKTRFEYLHPERFSTIRELYNQIWVCEDSLSHLTKRFPSSDWIDEDRQKDVIEEFKKFEKLIRANRLYLEPTLIIKLEYLQKSSWNIVSQMNKVQDEANSNQKASGKHHDSEEKQKCIKDNWIEANRKVEDFVQIRTEIESEFRRLLGEVS